jgi:hypothetical protein
MDMHVYIVIRHRIIKVGRESKSERAKGRKREAAEARKTKEAFDKDGMDS